MFLCVYIYLYVHVYIITPYIFFWKFKVDLKQEYHSSNFLFSIFLSFPSAIFLQFFASGKIKGEENTETMTC